MGPAWGRRARDPRWLAPRSLHAPRRALPPRRRPRLRKQMLSRRVRATQARARTSWPPRLRRHDRATSGTRDAAPARAAPAMPHTAEGRAQGATGIGARGAGTQHDPLRARTRAAPVAAGAGSVTRIAARTVPAAHTTGPPSTAPGAFAATRIRTRR